MLHETCKWVFIIYFIYFSIHIVFEIKKAKDFVSFYRRYLKKYIKVFHPLMTVETSCYHVLQDLWTYGQIIPQHELLCIKNASSVSYFSPCLRVSTLQNAKSSRKVIAHADNSYVNRWIRLYPTWVSYIILLNICSVYLLDQVQDPTTPFDVLGSLLTDTVDKHSKQSRGIL